MLGVEPWSAQVEVLEAVRDNARVAVRSGHKVGKSRTAAIIAWWFACTRPDARVILTSASGRQVREILWREVVTLWRGAKRPLGCPPPAERPDAGASWPDGRQIVGFTTDEPERMAGISGAALLFLVDEASGVPAAIFEAIEGNRAGGARLAMFSNPTRTSGVFYDAFHSLRHLWRCVRISSRDTPNVLAGEVLIPGLATAEWVQEKLEEWGEDSPVFQVRVEGNFPSQGSDTVIGLGLVEDAVTRWRDLGADGVAELAKQLTDRLELGVDVARFGDDETVVVIGRGALVLEIAWTQGADTARACGFVTEVAKRHARERERPLAKVDPGGNPGVADGLRDAGWIEVVECNFGRSPDAHVARDFVDLRAQMYFAARDWLKAGGAVPPTPKLEADLVAPTYFFDAKTRIRVESKDDIRKRLRRSTDTGDALVLYCYRPPAVPDAPASCVAHARSRGLGGLYG